MKWQFAITYIWAKFYSKPAVYGLYINGARPLWGERTTSINQHQNE